MAEKWWQKAVIYQIYPRSFMDSNGDGIGDIPGITIRLDYLKTLGVNAIWLGPIFDSPNDDNGYDVRDYYTIMREFGSMDDFKKLLGEAHARGIRVIIDIVANHTSDEHAWFVQSRRDESDKRDFYIWRDGKGENPPNNWGSFFTPSAWKPDARSGQYYLHLFSEKQPDLNWDNAAVRGEIYDMMRWWLDMGVDGFRLDAINAIKKPDGLPDSKLPPTYAEGYCLDPALYFNNPGLVEYLREMNAEVFAGRDVVSIGECSETTPEMAVQYASGRGDALNMLIHFEAVSLRDKWSVQKMREVQQRWADAAWGKAWNSQYLSNHDQPRQVSIYGDDGRHREASAKLLAMMLHTLPGTPFVYQGEELGMTNVRLRSIDAFSDISAHNDYKRLTGTGHTRRQALAWLNRYGRDNARTPMQWSAAKNAGFSAGRAWLSVNPNYRRINAEQQIADTGSVFHFYRELIALRKMHPVMVFGSYTDLSENDSCVYMYTRSLREAKWLVVLNLSGKKQFADLGNGGADVLLSNMPRHTLRSGRQPLPPWYAAILDVSGKEEQI